MRFPYPREDGFFRFIKIVFVYPPTSILAENFVILRNILNLRRVRYIELVRISFGDIIF